MKPSLADRFWSKVSKSEGCWLWTGATTGKPRHYGQIWHKGRLSLAHRVSLALAGIYAPPTMQVDHLCRNPRCVRPDHLEVVTASVNCQRAQDAKPLRTTCERGHPFVEGNIYIQPKAGRRACVLCRKERDRKRNYRTERRARALLGKGG